MDRTQAARLLLFLTFLYVIGFYFIGAAVKPGYSQISNFISEYNATGTARATTLTYAGFVATTALLSLFLAYAAPVMQVSGVSRIGFWLLWSLPFSFLLGAVAPCDLGCPLEGSGSQDLHNVFGVIAYFSMGLSIALLAFAPGFSPFTLRRLFMLLTGFAFPLVFMLMVQSEVASWRGLLQRLLDLAMAISLVLVAYTIFGTSEKTSKSVA